MQRDKISLGKERDNKIQSIRIYQPNKRTIKFLGIKMHIKEQHNTCSKYGTASVAGLLLNEIMTLAFHKREYSLSHSTNCISWNFINVHFAFTNYHQYSALQNIPFLMKKPSRVGKARKTKPLVSSHRNNFQWVLGEVHHCYNNHKKSIKDKSPSRTWITVISEDDSS